MMSVTRGRLKSGMRTGNNHLGTTFTLGPIPSPLIPVAKMTELCPVGLAQPQSPNRTIKSSESVAASSVLSPF